MGSLAQEEMGCEGFVSPCKGKISREAFPTQIFHSKCWSGAQEHKPCPSPWLRRLPPLRGTLTTRARSGTSRRGPGPALESPAGPAPRISALYLNCLVFIAQLGDSPLLATRSEDSFCVSLDSQTLKHLFHIVFYFPSSVFGPKYISAGYDLTKTHAGAINASDKF